jgi:hypothetical protein
LLDAGLGDDNEPEVELLLLVFDVVDDAGEPTD